MKFKIAIVPSSSCILCVLKIATKRKTKGKAPSTRTSRMEVRPNYDSKLSSK
jgi:hypothetical protein